MGRVKQPVNEFLDVNKTVDELVQRLFPAQQCQGCHRVGVQGGLRIRHRRTCINYHAMMVATASHTNQVLHGLMDHPRQQTVQRIANIIMSQMCSGQHAQTQQSMEVSDVPCASMSPARNEVLNNTPPLEPTESSVEVQRSDLEQSHAVVEELEQSELQLQLYDGASITVAQAVSYMLQLFKVQRTTTDELLDQICKAMAAVFMPQPNSFPNSVHNLYRLSRVDDVNRFKFFQCWQCQGVAFPPCSSTTYGELELSIMCSMCGAQQYEQITFGRHSSAQSIRRLGNEFYYVGLETLLQEYFFSNAEFCKMYAHRDTMQQPFFARASQQQLLDELELGVETEIHRLQGYFSDINIGVNHEVFCLEIGHDGFQPFQHSSYSVWGVWCRCKNVPPYFYNKAENMYPCMLIPPSCDVHACMELLSRDLKKLMPKTGAQQGVGNTVRVYDAYHKIERNIHVILVGVYADSPARDKVAMSLGHNSVLGCYWCCLPGQKSCTTKSSDGEITVDKLSAVRYMGYARPQPCLQYQARDSMDISAHKFFLVGADQIRYNPKHQRKRMLEASRIRQRVQDAKLAQYATLNQIRDKYNQEVEHLRQAIIMALNHHTDDILANPPGVGQKRQRCRQQSVDAPIVLDSAMTVSLSNGTNMHEDVIRRANEVLSRQEQHVVARHPTLSSDISLLAMARASSQLSSSVVDNKLSIHQMPPGAFSRLGVKGMSCFIRDLPYTCPNNIFVVPVAHSLLYGVVRDINRFIMDTAPSKNKYALTKEQRDIVAQRGKRVYAASDFPNAYKSIGTTHAQYKLKDWLDWSEVHCHSMLRDLLIGGDYTFTELYHRMHKAAVYFNKGRLLADDQNTMHQVQVELQILQLHVNVLFRYAAHLELHVDKNLLKSNLHIVCCRLYHQVLARGHSGDESELWIERCAGALKKISRNRSTTQCVESVIMKSMLLKAALQRHNARYNIPHVRDAFPACSNATFDAKSMFAAFNTRRAEQDDDQHSQHLLHKQPATAIAIDHVQTLKCMLMQDAEYLGVPRAQIHRVQRNDISVFTQAQLANHATISSAMQMRERKSQSYWININYGPLWKMTVGRVKYFLQIQGLPMTRSTNEIVSNTELAVVEVFLTSTCLPYPTALSVGRMEGTVCMQPSIDEVAVYLYGLLKRRQISGKRASKLWQELGDKYSDVVSTAVIEQQSQMVQLLRDVMVHAPAYQVKPCLLLPSEMEGPFVNTVNNMYFVDAVDIQQANFVDYNTPVSNWSAEYMEQAVVYDLQQSLDQDTCTAGMAYETLITLEMITEQVVHSEEILKFPVNPPEDNDWGEVHMGTGHIGYGDQPEQWRGQGQGQVQQRQQWLGQLVYRQPQNPPPMLSARVVRPRVSQQMPCMSPIASSQMRPYTKQYPRGEVTHAIPPGVDMSGGFYQDGYLHFAVQYRVPAPQIRPQFEVSTPRMDPQYNRPRPPLTPQFSEQQVAQQTTREARSALVPWQEAGHHPGAMQPNMRGSMSDVAPVPMQIDHLRPSNAPYYGPMHSTQPVHTVGSEYGQQADETAAVQQAHQYHGQQAGPLNSNQNLDPRPAHPLPVTYPSIIQEVEGTPPPAEPVQRHQYPQSVHSHQQTPVAGPSSNAGSLLKDNIVTPNRAAYHADTQQDVGPNSTQGGSWASTPRADISDKVCDTSNRGDTGPSCRQLWYADQEQVPDSAMINDPLPSEQQLAAARQNRGPATIVVGHPLSHLPSITTVSRVTTTRYNRWSQMHGPPVMFAPLSTQLASSQEDLDRDSETVLLKQNEELLKINTDQPIGAYMAYKGTLVKDERYGGGLPMVALPPSLRGEPIGPCQPEYRRWYHTVLLDYIAANLEKFYCPGSIPSQKRFRGPDMEFDNEDNPARQYFHVIQNEYGVQSPWFLIQDVDKLFQTTSSSVSTQLLLQSAKLYDVCRIMEVARTLVLCPLYCTWYKMLKIVLPNLDVLYSFQQKPRSKAGSVNFRDLKPGEMAHTMYSQQKNLHPWLEQQGYPAVHPDEMDSATVRWIGPIGVDVAAEYITIVNPVQVITAVDVMATNNAAFDSTVWSNLAGLLDVVTYLLGYMGPCWPITKANACLRPHSQAWQSFTPWMENQKWMSVQTMLQLWHIKTVQMRRYNLVWKVTVLPKREGWECPVCRTNHGSATSRLSQQEIGRQRWSRVPSDEFVTVVLNMQRGTAYVECNNQPSALGKKLPLYKLLNSFVKAVYGAEDHQIGDYTKLEWGEWSSNPRDCFKVTAVGSQHRWAPTCIIMSGIQSARGLEAMCSVLLSSAPTSGRLEKLYMEDPRECICPVPNFRDYRPRHKLAALNKINRAIKEFLQQEYGPSRTGHDVALDLLYHVYVSPELTETQWLPSKLHCRVPRWAYEDSEPLQWKALVLDKADHRDTYRSTRPSMPFSLGEYQVTQP